MRKLLPLLVVASSFGIGLGISVLAELDDPGPDPSWQRLGEAFGPGAVAASVERAARGCPRIDAGQLVIDCAVPPCVVYERTQEAGIRPLRACAVWLHHDVDAFSSVAPGVGEITAYVVAPPGTLRELPPRIAGGLAELAERWRAPPP